MPHGESADLPIAIAFHISAVPDDFISEDTAAAFLTAQGFLPHGAREL